MKNGDQMICQTYDGLMHKMNIVQNVDHTVESTGQNSLKFKVHNCDRYYFLDNTDAVEIDYDLLDRIFHSVSIDTVRHQSLYHNLIYKQ